MAYRIGISGWRYPRWRSTFYPADLPQRMELSFASRQLNSIEINGSFYSMQRPEYFRQWYSDTPDGFVFAVKGPRFITHMKKLKDVEEALANFFASGVFRLEEKLGPILWQFPERFSYDPKRFENFFKLLPKTKAAAVSFAKSKRGARMKGRCSLVSKTSGKIRYAVEVRSTSFLEQTFFDLLRKYNIASVVADTAGRWPRIEEQTADFIYLRLHGDQELYASGYSDKALDEWAKKIRRWASNRDAYVYFDNDAKVFAPFNASALAMKLGASDSLLKMPADLKEGRRR